MVDSARDLCGSLRVEGKNPKSVRCNNLVKNAVERKELLGARDEVTKDRFMEVYKEEKRKVKRCIYQNKKEVNEQFGRKMNQDVDGSKKLFWKEVNEGKLESCSRIKDGNGRG